MPCERPRIRITTARRPPPPLEECDDCHCESRREGSDLAGENAAGRAVMSDTPSGWREDARLPVGEPCSRMAVDRPALREGNGEGDDAWMTRKDTVIDGVKGTHATVVARLPGGRLDREKVERRA